MMHGEHHMSQVAAPPVPCLPPMDQAAQRAPEAALSQMHAAFTAGGFVLGQPGPGPHDPIGCRLQGAVAAGMLVFVVLGVFTKRELDRMVLDDDPDPQLARQQRAASDVEDETVLLSEVGLRLHRYIAIAKCRPIIDEIHGWQADAERQPLRA